MKMKSFGVFTLLLSLAVASGESAANKWKPLQIKIDHLDTKSTGLQTASSHAENLHISQSQPLKSNMLGNAYDQDIKQSHHTQFQNPEFHNQNQISQVQRQQDLAQQLYNQNLAEQSRNTNQEFYSQNQASQSFNQIQQSQQSHNQIESQQLDNLNRAQPYHNQNQVQQYHHQNQAPQHYNQNQAQQYHTQNHAQQYHNQNQAQQDQNQAHQYHNQNYAQQYYNQKKEQEFQTQNQPQQYNDQDRMISRSPVPQDQVQQQNTPTPMAITPAQSKGQNPDFFVQQQLYSVVPDNKQRFYKAESIQNARNKQNQRMSGGQQGSLFNGLQSTEIKASGFPQSYRVVSAFEKGVQPIVLPGIRNSHSAPIIVSGLKNLPSLPALVYSAAAAPAQSSPQVAAYSRPWHQGGAYVRHHPYARYVYSHIL